MHIYRVLLCVVLVCIHIYLFIKYLNEVCQIAVMCFCHVKVFIQMLFVLQL